jgi:hypothetical protein
MSIYSDGFNYDAGGVPSPKTAVDLTPQGLNPTSLNSVNNWVVNPNGLVHQRRKVLGIADLEMGPDGWYALTQTTTIDFNGGSGVLILHNPNAAQKAAMAQIVEFRDSLPFQGQSATFSAVVDQDFGGTRNIGIAILKWNGSGGALTDAPPKELVNNWSSTNYTPGNFFVSTSGDYTLSVLGAKVWALEHQVAGLISVEAEVSTVAGFDNLVLFIWAEDTVTQHTDLRVNGVELVFGHGRRQVAPRSFAEELAICQRRYEKSYNAGVLPGTSSSPGGATWIYLGTNSIAASQVYGTIRYAVPKLKTVTPTVYGYAGGSGQVSNSGGTDIGANTGGIPQSGENGFTVWNNSGGTATTTGNIVLFHWVCDTGF